MTASPAGTWEKWDGDRPAVSAYWRTEVYADSTWTDPANEFWGIGLTEGPDGARAVELLGPCLRPRTLDLTAGWRHWGVELAAHVVVRGVPKHGLLDASVDLPVAGSWFEVAGVRFPFVAAPELPALMDAMFGQGVLVADPALGAALAGTAEWSERSLQRHSRARVGLSPKQVAQRRRVRHAYALMQDGRSLSEAATEAGYADQAHMTRDFGLLVGSTPARILQEHLEGRRGPELR